MTGRLDVAVDQASSTPLAEIREGDVFTCGCRAILVRQAENRLVVGGAQCSKGHNGQRKAKGRDVYADDVYPLIVNTEARS